jgi:PKD repeat protein
VSFINSSTNASSYLWSYGNSVTSTTTAVTHTYVYTQSGVYTVSLVANNGTVTDTLTRTHYITVNTSSPGAFPSTNVLDNFNRSNGAIGSNWSGSTSGYSIAGNKLDVGSGDDIFWSPTSFGTDQEVFVTFTTIDQSGSELDLLLKSQSNSSWNSGLIEVWYDPAGQRAQVWTFSSSQDWVQRGADIPVALSHGDQLGARATADGQVEVYRNGTLLATRDVTGWPYYANGGYIGLWFINADDTVLDDFGGGTVTASSSPIAAFRHSTFDRDPYQQFEQCQ